MPDHEAKPEGELSAADKALMPIAYELWVGLLHQKTRAIELRQAWRAAQKDKAIGRVPMAFDVLLDEIAYDQEIITEFLTEKTFQAALRSTPAGGTITTAGAAGVCADVSSSLDRRRRELDYLVSAFNEREEGRRVFTTTEPFVRLGEQSGVRDGILAALDSLMATYVGEIRAPLEIPATDRIGLLAAPTVSGKRRAPIRTWQGVISASIRESLCLNGKTGIISLSEKPRVTPSGALTGLAHEAAHYWASVILPDKTEDGLNRDEDTEAREHTPVTYFEYLRWHFVGGFLDEKDKYLPNPVSYSEFSAPQQDRQALFDDLIYARDSCYYDANFAIGNALPAAIASIADEIFCDLYAWLVAGPAYFVEHADQNPPDGSMDFWRPFDHPPENERLRFGYWLTSNYLSPTVIHTEWTRDWTRVAGNLERLPRNWTTELSAAVTRRDALRGVAKHSQESLLRLSEMERMYEDRFWRSGALAIRACQAHRYHELLHDYLAGAFVRSPRYLPELNKTSMENAFQHAVDIAERIWFRQEVVSGERASDVAAAASVRPIIRRPFLPTDRLYHSLLASAAK